MTDNEANLNLTFDGEGMRDVAEHLPSAPVAPAHGIAAIALSMAMKFHDITIIKDGTMYQQYKMEGRNIRELHLDMVFETAIQIERHLLASNERIAGMVIDAISDATIEIVDDDAGDTNAAGDAPA